MAAVAGAGTQKAEEVFANVEVEEGELMPNFVLGVLLRCFRNEPRNYLSFSLIVCWTACVHQIKLLIC